MALLRNLRNIIQADVDKQYIVKVAEALQNPHAIKNSKQLPFRFLSAYKELEDMNDLNGLTHIILNALENAVKESIKNVKGFDIDTKVVIASDVSGSMTHPISRNSSVMNYDIGLMLSMLMQYKCDNVITGIFGDDWKVKNLPKGNILQNTVDLLKIRDEVGYSTNGYKVINDLINKKYKADKIMIFTDCQLWDSENPYGQQVQLNKMWNKYLKDINPNAKLYLFDLSGYGNTPVKINDNNVYMISGWSDKVFDVLENIEKGEDTLKIIKDISII